MRPMRLGVGMTVVVLIGGFVLPALILPTTTASADSGEPATTRCTPAISSNGRFWAKGSCLGAASTSLSSLVSTGINPSTRRQDPGAAPGDRFGVSLSEDGQAAIVGASGADDSAGAAYIYVKGTSSWPTSPTVTLVDPVSGQNFFGRSVSISENIAVVGAYDAAAGAGVAYVYGTNGGNSQWSSTPFLTLTSPDGSASFGSAVSAEGQSLSVIVGADSADSGAGAAFIYEDTLASGWSTKPIATLSAPSGSSGFGYSVAIGYNAAIVGAYDSSGYGKAYIYIKGEYAWGAKPKSVTLEDPARSAADGFGYSVAITSNNIALVGAIGTDKGEGEAYIYGAVKSQWQTTPIRNLKDPGSLTTDGFGASVNIGTTATISSLSGKAYVFTDTSSGWGRTPSGTLLDPSGSKTDGFGTSVSQFVSSVFIGAPNGSNGRGTVYIYNGVK